MDARAIAHRFTIGTVLADAIRVFARQFLILMAVVAVALLPIAFVEQWLFGLEFENRFYTPIIAPTLVGVAAVIGSLVAEASMVTVVLHRLNGRSVSYRDLLAWLPVAGIVISGGLMVWLPDFLGRLSYFVLSEQFPDSEWIVRLPYYTGLTVYLVVLVFWYMFAPVVVAERTGLHAGLTRSAQLGKGQRWRVFALLLILLVVGLAISAALEIAAYTYGGTMPGQLGELASAVIRHGGFGVYTVFSFAVSITMYHHLRLREEGMDSARAVTVFD